MKKFLLKIFFFISTLLFSQTTSETDSIPTDWYNIISLEELMDLKVSIGTAKSMSIRETPSIVTVISSDEIKSISPRDLIDLLHLVPGFESASEIQGHVSFGIRGHWGSEGKFSLFVDEHEYNDLLYGSVPFGNHFPVDQIEKIEIIRGPGSAIYGGTSMLGVIKITTKSKNFEGLSVSQTNGKMGKDWDFRNNNFIQRNNTFVQFGKKIKDLKVYTNLYLSRAQRSEKDFINYSNEERTTFNNRSDLRSTSLFARITYKNLNTSFWYDNYVIQTPSFYGNTLGNELYTWFKTLSANIDYDLKINEKLSIKPSILIKNQNPWSSFDDRDSLSYVSDRTITRQNYKIEALYEPRNNLNVLSGVQFFQDNGRVIEGRFGNFSNPINLTFPPDRTKHISYNNISLFSQANLNTKWFNFTFGGRYEKHSEDYEAVVPRVGITKAFDKMHFKLLGSQSFKTPYIYNFSNNNIQPEKATIIELEQGARLSRRLHFTNNIYYISISDLLEYNINTNGSFFTNASKEIGSVGLESEVKYQGKRLDLNMNYSFYLAQNPENAPLYQVRASNFIDNQNQTFLNQHFLGFSPHKFSARFNYKANKTTSISMNGNIFSYKYGYEGIRWVESEYKELMKKHPATFMFNVFFTRNDLFSSPIDITIGVCNILDQDYRIVTPYQAFQSSLPSAGREILIKLSYNLR